MQTQTTMRTSQNVDLAMVGHVGKKLRELTGQLAVIFPERDHLINQILYAILTHEHVLVHGVFGTGKSDLVTTLFGSFTGANVFSIALTKFMSEGHVVGMPDPKIMREEGHIHHRPEGSILEAHFAELDELFDANAPLLRVLLGILNERNFKRGRQFELAKLHTAVGSTNSYPKDVTEKCPELGAVIDRFLFQCEVSYLAQPESRRRMYEKYLRGEKPSVVIPYEELVAISEIVVSANQITDPHFIVVYDQVIEAYRAAMKGQVVSDRRACKLLKLAEANALLFGRFDVDYEDIQAVRWGLCMGNDQAQHDAFQRVAEPILEKAKNERQQSIDVVQLKLLAEYESRTPVVPPQCDDADLVRLRRELAGHRKEVAEIKPQFKSTEDRQKQILRVIDERIADVDKRIQG